ncbi:MAG: hypothetical protein BGO41_07995 [Clostridiales bacterium 38-18]|nr:MAG: hypothetical protein BGO41_07995 [Clostridiales bacterium 38-18]
MIHVQLSQDLITYLKGKGKNTLTYEVTISGGGCCGFFELEDLSYSIPKKPELFYHETIEGIEVYLTKRARYTGGVVQMSLQKRVIGAAIHVTGVQIQGKS